MATKTMAGLGARLGKLVNWESTRARSGMKDIDASACGRICEALGWPQRHFRTVHITGSKGKGTVGALVGAGLWSAGLRVGVVSSPHVVRVTERVRLSQKSGLVEINESVLASAFERAIDEVERRKIFDASWFDVFIASSFLVLKEHRCDVVVVECGLGGRRDSTNVLSSKICVLTSVELEHTEVLGDTVEAIATEKAAIASKGGTLVVAATSSVPERARRAARRVAKRRGATLKVAALLPRKTSRYDLEASNLAVAKMALDELGRRRLRQKKKKTSFSRKSFVSGSLLSNPRALDTALKALPGRREFLSKDLVLDGCHTDQSLRAFAAFLRRSERPVVALVALAAEKNERTFATAVASALRPTALICAPLSPGETHKSQQLAEAHRARGLPHVHSETDIDTALLTATTIAKDNDAILAVFGSFALCGHVKNIMDEAKKRKEENDILLESPSDVHLNSVN